jgi:DNA-binding MltR family transcriptional regulator
MAKHLLPKELDQDSKDLNEAMNGQSPLACVLIGVSALEQAITTILGGFFISGSTSDGLLDPRGRLDFSVRCKLAYSLGLIPKSSFQNLGKLGEIRNIFAHNHLHSDWSHPEVVKLCGDLRSPLDEPDVPSAIANLRTVLEKPREKFIITVALLHGLLTTEAHRVQRRTESAEQLSIIAHETFTSVNR